MDDSKEFLTNQCKLQREPYSYIVSQRYKEGLPIGKKAHLQMKHPYCTDLYDVQQDTNEPFLCNESRWNR